MDIFTTQLTRVVPVPIKPTNLKVKALVKNAAMSALSQDDEHLEDDEYYSSRVFAKKSSKQKQPPESSSDDNHSDADAHNKDVSIDDTMEAENSLEEESSEQAIVEQPQDEATKASDATYDNIFVDKKAVKTDASKVSSIKNKENDKVSSKHLDLYA